MVWFWIIAGGLALAVGALLALAVLRARGGAAPANYDIKVYRDQLAEVDRDLARGVVSEDEAGRVRLEVSRRILEADKAAQAEAAGGRAPRGASLAAAGLIGLVLVGGAAGLYARLGAPGYPDLPLTARIEMAEEARKDRVGQDEAEARFGAPYVPPPDADPQFLALMERLRGAVAGNPDELQGQMLLARNEAILGNFAAAHPAQGSVIALKGAAATADDHATHADLMVLAAGGFVSPEAEAALERALALEPRNGPARYYMGLMHLQNQRPDLAFRIWRALLDESLPNAPWVAPITAQIEQVAELAGIRYVPPAPAGAPERGPSAGDMAAAAEMTPEERQEMIRGMVDGLAERLAGEGGPPEDWARLINALGVLGETERAAAIWTEAQTVFADAPEAVEAIRVAAVRAGVAE